MRTLMLMRHASALDADADRERPLTRRGRDEASRIGVWLASGDYTPELILSSDALRAQATAEAVGSAFENAPPLIVAPDLYLASPARMLDHVSRIEDACSAALLVVHNPGASELAAWLQGGAEAAALERAERGFVPAALAVFRIERRRWAEVIRGCGRLVAFAEPSLVP
jgi:phosphohistidine phosphatase